MTALLTARGLTVNASIGGATVPVLRGLDLTLARGQVLALVGESGAGKSMIGRTIAGDLPPGFAIAAGSLTFDGQDLTGPRARRLLGREIAFIPQEPMTALNPVRTIGAQFNEHLAAGLAGPGGADRCGAGGGASAGRRRSAAAISAPAIGRHVPARADCHGLRQPAAAGDRR